MKRNCETCRYADRKRNEIVRFNCRYNPTIKELLSLYPKRLKHNPYNSITEW